ncbi:hypothetical protein [Methanobrevibacter sp.]|uniref:hypothetical protein n=1 Tax=Methanobrevibacter sp. TaxID=66852 RepID=UPI003975F6F3
MSSKSATVMVIFIVAMVAFCLASVFGAMTGPISILPNKTNEGVLDNLSSFVENGHSGQSYGSNSYNDHGGRSSSSYDNSHSVETTTDSGSSSQDSGGSSSSSSGSSSSSSGSSSSGSSSSGGSSSGPSSGGSSSSSGSPNVETTTG